MRRVNWPLWTGLVLSAAAFVSYFAFFSRFPATRDIPWANAILFVVAIVLVIAGWRRAPRKILASIVAVLALAIAAAFVFAVTAGSKLPAAHGAPRNGERVPQFSLLDTNQRTVTLDQLLAQSPRGVLLVFYRGYW
jgi:MFS superfamily sulfate permease-like transporter